MYRDMKHILDYLLTAAVALAVTSCNMNGKGQTQAGDATAADSVTAAGIAERQTADGTSTETIIEAERLITLLGEPESEEQAKACGLTLVYNEDLEEEGGLESGLEGADNITTKVIVYGKDIEKGEKQEFYYALKCLSDHACYFLYQSDTSMQAKLAFKDEGDANRFVESLMDYGVLIVDDTFFVPTERLPEGKSIRVDSTSDFNISYDLSKPMLIDGFYVIQIYYYA